MRKRNTTFQLYSMVSISWSTVPSVFPYKYCQSWDSYNFRALNWRAGDIAWCTTAAYPVQGSGLIPALEVLLLWWNTAKPSCGGKGLFIWLTGSASTPWWKEVGAGTWRQRLMQRHGGVLLTGTPFYKHRTSHSGLGPPMQVLIKKCSTDLPVGQSGKSIYLVSSWHKAN